MCAITRSPGMKPCTPSPTCLTTPAISLPGEKGRSGLNWYLLWMRRTSGKFTPLAFTDTRSCPLPGFGEGTSSTTSASGGPQFLHSTAFMRDLSGFPGHHKARLLRSQLSGYHALEGGGHGRQCDIAAIRGLLDALVRLLHRLSDPDRDHRPYPHCDIWKELHPAIDAGQDLLGRHPVPGRPAGLCRDPFLALPRRDAGKDAHLRENRRRQHVRAAVHRKVDRSLFRLPRFDHPDIPRFPLDRLRQAQTGMARQTCRNRGDPGRGRLNPRSLTTGTHARKGEDMSWGFWIVVGIVVAAVVWLISIYNGLVAQRNRFKNAFAQIDVQLKRRYDLIPNLVESVKGYMQHERGTLDAVIKARGSAVSAAQAAAANPGNPGAMQGLSQAEGALGGALGRLIAVFEQYPGLKANRHVLGLQEELSSTENKIAFSRQAYNDSVMEYNTKRESFPDNIFAGMFGFSAAELLQSTDTAEERKAPKVSFS